MEPIEFIASESKKYAFCTCKLSKKAPLCDGTLQKYTDCNIFAEDHLYLGSHRELTKNSKNE